jgi:hypothetical protein
MQIGQIAILACAALGSTLRSGTNAGELIREIDDANSGDRWLLVRNASHPEGPGLLLLVSIARVVPAHTTPLAETPAPIIRIGDRVIVEENTATVNARLDGAAMAPASAGLAFSVRLSIGGQIVRAVAVAPGRAVLQQETRQ